MAPYEESRLKTGELLASGYTVSEVTKKELFIECECHGEILKIDKFSDEYEYYLTVFKYYFPSISFLRRIRYALDVLRGKGIETADLIISKENFNKIKKFK